MIVRHEKSLFATSLYHRVYAFAVIYLNERLLAFIKFDEMSILARVTYTRIMTVPEWLSEIVRLDTNKAKVTVSLINKLINGVIRDLDLIAVQSKKSIVAELIVSDKNIVIGVGNYRIAETLIIVLDLRRSKTTVGKGSVTVKISLIKIAALR
jgi:hypothetical protein